MSSSDSDKPCRCNEPVNAGLAVEPVRKIELPDGMTEGTFVLTGTTGEELGQQADTFLRSIDYDKFEASSCYVVQVNATHRRTVQGGTIRSSFGPFWTEIQVSRR